MRTLMAVLAFTLLLFPCKIKAGERWIRLASPHFEMFTTNSEKQAKAALQVFEQVRYFFLQNSRSKTAPTTPVRIIAFRSEKEYKPYRLNEGAFAYYLRSRKVDCIVMQDISSEHYPAVIHEYTHLIVEHSNLKYPLWLQEGLAELYSSLEPKGNQALVGRPIEGWLMILGSQRWLDWNTLFGVDHDSPYYNESNKMSIFYAQSWAMTHMLELGKAYHAGIGQFLGEVNAGKGVPDALQSVYGKTLPQLTQDLHAYFNQSTVQAAVFDVKLTKSDLEPEVSDATELAVDLALADLLAAREKTSSEALKRLSELAQSHPESPDVQESLGYLAWTHDNRDKARECFKLAMDRGSTNTEMLIHYSQLMRESGASPDQITSVLRRVVSLQPDSQPAWLRLGFTATELGQYGSALDAFSHIKSVTPEQAYSFFFGQALCYYQLKAYKQSRENAVRAKPYAANPDQILSTSELLRQLDAIEKPATASTSVLSAPLPAIEDHSSAPERPTLTHRPGSELPRDKPTVNWPENLQHVEGLAKFFDCDENRNRLHIVAGGKEMVFELKDPQSIMVRNTKSGEVVFSCGVQKPANIGIFYVPAVEPGHVGGSVSKLVY